MKLVLIILLILCLSELYNASSVNESKMIHRFNHKNKQLNGYKPKFMSKELNYIKFNLKYFDESVALSFTDIFIPFEIIDFFIKCKGLDGTITTNRNDFNLYEDIETTKYFVNIPRKHFSQGNQVCELYILYILESKIYQ